MSEKPQFTKTVIPGTVKDARTGAVLATNDSEYRAIIARRKEKARQEKLNDEVICLRRDLDIVMRELKHLKETIAS